MILGRIIAKDPDDYDFLRPMFELFPFLHLTQEEIFEEDVPTQIIGWGFVKKLYPQHSILDKQIDSNIYWTFSKKEDEKNLIKDNEVFLNKVIESWLPKDFILFDPAINLESFQQFVEENFNFEEKSYLYYDNGALHIRSGRKNIIINTKMFSVFFDDYKKVLTTFINQLKCMVHSYKNLSEILDLDSVGCLYSFENIRWVKYKSELTSKYFDIIPGANTRKHIPFIMSQVDKFVFSEDEKNSIKRACKRDYITEWLSQREINFKSDFKTNRIKFFVRGSNRMSKFNYSNKRALTGRIMCVDSYNPQMLPKKNEERANIISRFENGRIVVFDYTSFESRIALYYCEDQEFIQKYYDKDLHIETAKIIFGNKDEFLEEEREFAKIVNHATLYGASKGTVLDKISFLKNPEESYFHIKKFLDPLFKKSERLKKQYEEKGYIVNDWGTIIYPEKEHALLSNYCSSTATEIIVDKIFEIKDLLKKYKSDIIFQVHDSIVFDIHPEEKKLIKEITDTLLFHNGMRYSLNYSYGFDFKNLSKEINIRL